MVSPNLVPRQLLALIDEPARSQVAGSPRLLALLGEAIARAEASGPWCRSSESWWHYLAGRFPIKHDLEQALGAWCTDDLGLCHACAEGNPEAVDAFVARFVPVIGATLGRLRLREPLREEVQQDLLSLLLVGDADRPPLVTTYQGLGKLAHWLRVVVSRNARRALQQEKQLAIPSVDLVDRLVDPAAGADLLGAKKAYRDAFRAAFRRALATLAPREANLLRQRYGDGLTLQQVGAIYRVHHTTAHRWLEQIRIKLLERTRREMADQLSLADEEWDTVMRLIESNLDLTLRTLFDPVAASSTDTGEE